MIDYNKLRDHWLYVAEGMDNVADTFRANKTPADTAKALDDLAGEFKSLADVIREQF